MGRGRCSGGRCVSAQVVRDLVSGVDDQDLVENFVFVKASLLHSPKKVPSVYWYADVLMVLDSLLGGCVLRQTSALKNKVAVAVFQAAGRAGGMGPGESRIRMRR